MTKVDVRPFPGRRRKVHSLSPDDRREAPSRSRLDEPAQFLAARWGLYCFRTFPGARPGRWDWGHRALPRRTGFSRHFDGQGGSHAQPCPSKRSEEHTSELQSRLHLVCRLLLEKKKKV